MRIYLERSGGFAGLRLKAMVDSEKLSEEEAAKLFSLVKSADFFNLPPAITAQEQGADRFQYRVTIECEGKRHSVEIQEAAISPSLRPLIRWLTAALKK